MRAVEGHRPFPGEAAPAARSRDRAPRTPPRVLDPRGLEVLQRLAGNRAVARLVAPDVARHEGSPPVEQGGSAAPVPAPVPAPASAPAPAPATRPAQDRGAVGGAVPTATAAEAVASKPVPAKPPGPAVAAEATQALTEENGGDGPAAAGATSDDAVVADDATDAAGGATPAAASPPAVPAATFVVPDVDALLPAAPGPSPGRDARVGALRSQLDADRGQAEAALNGFVEARQAKIAGLSDLRPQIGTTLAAVETSVSLDIDQAAAAQLAVVRSSAAAARASITAAAARDRAQIEARRSATTAAVRASTAGARTAMQTAKVAAHGQTEAAQAAQLGRLGGSYATAEAAFAEAAASSGALAVRNAAARAAEYRSHKIHDTDSFLDGYLTDNRCDAQAEAAEKVGESYRSELAKEGEKQILALRARRPTDEAAVRQVAQESQGQLSAALQTATTGLTTVETTSVQNADATATAATRGIASIATTTVRAVARHESAQVALIQKQARARKAAVHQAATEAQTALLNALDVAVTEATAGVGLLTGTLSGSAVPDPARLHQALLDGGGQLDAQLEQFGQAAGDRLRGAEAALREAGTTTIGDLVAAGSAAVLAAAQTGAGAVAAVDGAAGTATEGLQAIQTAHGQVAETTQTTFVDSSATLVGALRTGYDQLSANFSAGAAHQATAVREGLTAAVEHDLPGVITTEAGKAYDQVKPRWQSVLKWIIIIALVLVVAIVLGPMVIGAVTGAAAAAGLGTGAAALVGTVVGGAIVGAGTSAATTVVDNAFAGRDLTTGIGRAMVIGAVGGALGGAASGLMAGPMQGMTALARYGTQVAIDTTINTGMGLATGELTWQNFGTGLAMSLFVNGVTAHPRIQSLQHSITTRSSTTVRETFTPTPPPAGRGGASHVTPVEVPTAPEVRSPTAPEVRPAAAPTDLGPAAPTTAVEAPASPTPAVEGPAPAAPALVVEPPAAAAPATTPEAPTSAPAPAVEPGPGQVQVPEGTRPATGEGVSVPASEIPGGPGIAANDNMLPGFDGPAANDNVPVETNEQVLKATGTDDSTGVSEPRFQVIEGGLSDANAPRAVGGEGPRGGGPGGDPPPSPTVEPGSSGPSTSEPRSSGPTEASTRSRSPRETVTTETSDPTTRQQGPVETSVEIPDAPVGDLNRRSDAYLKERGVDPHTLKDGLVEGSVSRYDIYEDRAGNLWAMRKAGRYGSGKDDATYLGKTSDFEVENVSPGQAPGEEEHVPTVDDDPAATHENMRHPPPTADELVDQVLLEMEGRRDTDHINTWELTKVEGPHAMSDNLDPSLGDSQERYYAHFREGATGDKRLVSINWDPDTGLFGIIKFSSKDPSQGGGRSGGGGRGGRSRR